MKLILKQSFSIEVGDTEEVIKGTLQPLTKAEQKEFEKAFNKHTKLAKDLRRKGQEYQRLAKQLEIAEKPSKEDFERLYTLEDEIEEDRQKLEDLETHEATAKKRFEMSVESNDLPRLVELCELVGYRVILGLIQQDVDEKKGNSTPA